MTDNEIIKALECCSTTMAGECKECPLYKRVDNCTSKLTKNALDLINRQKADKIIAERHEKDARELYKNVVLQLKTAKSEAIKEFAERVCKDRVSNDPVVIAVKVELAEMTEENNG